jgi:TIR domain
VGEVHRDFDLFLSHNSADKAWTERLASAIESDRTGPPLKVFFDKWDIPHGADIPAELEQGLQKSRYIGLVLSPESLSSDWIVLERSTAIFRDPAARHRSLIPLMRRTCKLPDMLARLRYLDFRRDHDFEEGVATLVGILRGVPLPRGAEVTEADVYFREDADLLRQHRRIFNRQAFRVACVEELFLPDLLEAINDTVAALNTGSLYSRSGKLLSTFHDSHEYRLPEFKRVFGNIADKLTRLQREVVEFKEFFRTVNPGSADVLLDLDFTRMVQNALDDNPSAVKPIFQHMDAIDQTRDEILSELNSLLSKCGIETFQPIDLSSTVFNRIGPFSGERVAMALGKVWRWPNAQLEELYTAVHSFISWVVWARSLPACISAEQLTAEFDHISVLIDLYFPGLKPDFESFRNKNQRLIANQEWPFKNAEELKEEFVAEGLNLKRAIAWECFDAPRALNKPVEQSLDD